MLAGSFRPSEHFISLGSLPLSPPFSLSPSPALLFRLFNGITILAFQPPSPPRLPHTSHSSGLIFLQLPLAWSSRGVQDIYVALQELADTRPRVPSFTCGPEKQQNQLSATFKC